MEKNLCGDAFLRVLLKATDTIINGLYNGTDDVYEAYFVDSMDLNMNYVTKDDFIGKILVPLGLRTDAAVKGYFLVSFYDDFCVILSAVSTVKWGKGNHYNIDSSYCVFNIGTGEKLQFQLVERKWILCDDFELHALFNNLFELTWSGLLRGSNHSTYMFVKAKLRNLLDTELR